MALTYTILSAHTRQSHNVNKYLSNQGSYEELTNITVHNKKEYCNRYNYNLNIEIPENIDDITPIKHNLLKKYIEQKQSDWICWIDADAIIMNMTIPLDVFTSTYDDIDFIIGEDWNGINSGVFFLRANEKSLKFIEICETYEPPYNLKNCTPFWWWNSEQCAMTMNMSSLNTLIVHHSLFNGYLIEPRPDNDWRKYNLGPFNKEWQIKKFEIGDFVLHLVGDYLNNKISNANFFIDKVIK